jgi:hypothetical protein
MKTLGPLALVILTGCQAQLSPSALFRGSSPATTAPASAAEGSTEAAPAATTESPKAAAPAKKAEEPKPDHGAEFTKHTAAFIEKVQAKCNDEKLLQEINSVYGAIRSAHSDLYNKASYVRDKGSAADKTVVETKLAEADDAIAACLKLPADHFKGKDGVAARAAFSAEAAKWSKKNVVKVVIDDDAWDRKTGIGDNGAMYDHSWLHAYIAVGEGSTGEVWFLTARKDHINGDKIKFDTYIPTKVAPIKLPLK